ncbi:MAG TPA: hypothetical protein VLA93_08315 [Pyrinomonadaceae bacterium]|nr:hypothetical protein [Pyrinomonadaceae bacterium]
MIRSIEPDVERQCYSTTGSNVLCQSSVIYYFFLAAAFFVVFVATGGPEAPARRGHAER